MKAKPNIKHGATWLTNEKSSDSAHPREICYKCRRWKFLKTEKKRFVKLIIYLEKRKMFVVLLSRYLFIYNIIFFIFSITENYIFLILK